MQTIERHMLNQTVSKIEFLRYIPGFGTSSESSHSKTETHPIKITSLNLQCTCQMGKCYVHSLGPTV